MTISIASDRSLLVSFGDEISFDIHRNVVRLTALLTNPLPADVYDVHPAYTSILITFDPLKMSHSQLNLMVCGLLERMKSVSLPESRISEIPVCYGESFGPDLAEVASLKGLTPDQVIEIHSSADYLVYFLGFSPGFPYLGGMPESIAAPRLATPRKQVPAGSVAVGGKQTGIYPVASPGGWRIIGRTPLRLFTPAGSPLTLLQMGDRVRFQPITLREFECFPQAS